MESRRTLLQRRALEPGAKEVANGTPVELTVERGAPPPIREVIQQYVRQELSQSIAESGSPATFEEEDDFEEPEHEHDILSGYQILLLDPEDLGLVETLDGAPSQAQDAPQSSPLPEPTDPVTPVRGADIAPPDDAAYRAKPSRPRSAAPPVPGGENGS